MVSKGKKQRIKKTVRLYYGENLTQEEISEKVGVSRRTIAKYLNSDEAEEFISPFDKKEEYEIRKMVEEDIEKIKNFGEGLFKEAFNEGDLREKVQAYREYRSSTKDVITMLDDLGVLRKTPDRTEVSGDLEVNFNTELVGEDETS